MFPLTCPFKHQTGQVIKTSAKNAHNIQYLGFEKVFEAIFSQSIQLFFDLTFLGRSSQPNSSDKGGGSIIEETNILCINLASHPILCTLR